MTLRYGKTVAVETEEIGLECVLCLVHLYTIDGSHE